MAEPPPSIEPPSIEPPSTKTRSGLGMLAFTAAAVCVSAIVAFPWPRPTTPVITVGQRQPLREIVLEQLGGGTWRLSEHRGHVILINYWASWCGPCRTETPGLVHLSGSIRGVDVVGISMDTGDRAPVSSFVQHFHVSYPIAFPPALSRLPTFSQLAAGMVGLPTTVLVDREGRVAKTYVGETQEREFRKDVEKLLAE